MRRSLSLSFSFMCAFLRQKKKERKNEEMFVEFFIGEELLKKPMRTYYLNVIFSPASRLPRRKIKARVGGGVFYVVRKSARAREREVLTNQRASSSSPSFFFLARKSEKTYGALVCAFLDSGLCLTASTRFIIF